MFVMLTGNSLYSGCIYKHYLFLSHVFVYLPIGCYNRKEEMKMNNQWNYLREGNTNPLYNNPIESDLIEGNHIEEGE
ncbi:hypothetical protein Syn7803US44_102 [Synechococcus phage ACG-2014f]|uniref:Uncharacterized protein n=2 Tax=Synechococcus phage ACG-2014f TaxID=1493511 RepID=A0A0E3HRQ7_9CAUD|nr:hypothetical protein Syn7803US44_102 [Synechococcus phage ACG-2014f]